MPYSVQLQEFGRWFRQLWAESLGKEGRGILPINAVGPADQHSQLQFYNQGELLQSMLFVTVSPANNELKVPPTQIQAAAYLSGHSFAEILQVEQQATALSLYRHGRSSMTLHLAELTPTALGQLFMCFELAVTYLGELLQVNTFDQPGVEESKQMMYALLGRPGFGTSNLT
jgi:glucose-6-phosphate isomerase